MTNAATLGRRVYDPSSVKQAGEGAVEVPNPFAGDLFSLPDVDQDAYDAIVPTAPSGAAAGRAGDLIAKAKQFVGTPYKWGGSSPLGFDCSGFTQYVYKQFGVNLPRISYQQAASGKRIPISELRPGDLVGWDTSSRNAGADHIAIYIGDGKVIHAPKPGDKVKISSLWNTAHAWGVAMNL